MARGQQVDRHAPSGLFHQAQGRIFGKAQGRHHEGVVADAEGPPGELTLGTQRHVEKVDALVNMLGLEHGRAQRLGGAGQDGVGGV